MQECDWTGTAAAVTALALTAAAWLWPADEAPHATAPVAGHPQMMDDRGDHDSDMARWRSEARRWDGSTDHVQLSAAGSPETTAPILR